MEKEHATISSKGSSIYHKLTVTPLKRLFSQYITPTSINLSGGLPREDIFPFSRIEVTVNEPDEPTYTMVNGEPSLPLNYCRGEGYAELRDWINAHVHQMHNELNTYRTCITASSTDALTKIFMLLNGDTIIFDNLAYNSSLSACAALGRNVIGVSSDMNGMIPSSLREQIIFARQQGLNPDMVVLVPTAQNPTGITMPYSRKKEIYQVCQDLDILIIEDDAYYYIYFGDDDSKTVTSDDVKSYPGLQNLPKSFLSMDVDGRVIRIDTVSKFIAPGLRLGWIAGPEEFIFKFQLLQGITTQFPSALSQSVFLGLMKLWGENGLHTHLQEIQQHYRRQAQAMYTILHQQLFSFILTHQVKLTKPTGGMFMWLDVFPPSNNTLVAPDALFKEVALSGVITSPGFEFIVPSLRDPDTITTTLSCTDDNEETVTSDSTDNSNNNSSDVTGVTRKRSLQYLEEEHPVSIRLSFSAATIEQITYGATVIAEAVRKLLNE